MASNNNSDKNSHHRHDSKRPEMISKDLERPQRSQSPLLKQIQIQIRATKIF